MKRTIKIIVAILAAVALLAGILLFCRQCKDTGDPPAADTTTTTTTSVSTTIVGDTTTTTGDDTNLTTTTEQAAQTTTTTAPEDTNTVAHVWSEWTVKAATCTAAGSKTRTCADCGETQTQAVAAAGHKWDKGKVTVEPTSCTDKGSKLLTCQTCNETKTAVIDGKHTYGAWQWEEYQYTIDYGKDHPGYVPGFPTTATYTSHRQYRLCAECGRKETDGTANHSCQRGSKNHTITRVKEGKCDQRDVMRSTCKICGWYVEYEGEAGKHNLVEETFHLTDYGPYTNELDASIYTCTDCGGSDLFYRYGKGFEDNNRYRLRISLSQGVAFMSPSPHGYDAFENPTMQTVKRDFTYDSEGYVSSFTIYWWYNGVQYNQVIPCGREEILAWFGEYDFVEEFQDSFTYHLRCYGREWRPYKISWTS